MLKICYSNTLDTFATNTNAKRKNILRLQNILHLYNILRFLSRYLSDSQYFYSYNCTIIIFQLLTLQNHKNNYHQTNSILMGMGFDCYCNSYKKFVFL